MTIDRASRQVPEPRSSAEVTGEHSQFRLDLERIRFSPYFSRLSAVTQVIAQPGAGPLIHNRLTHSIKVTAVARAIAAYSSAWTPPEFVVCDCAEGVNLAEAVASARARGIDPDKVTLLLREVHALGEAEQAEIARVVGGPDSPRVNTPRIISTSSVSLFDRVRKGAFDERLFYRLNVMHIVVKEKTDGPDEA